LSRRTQDALAENIARTVPNRTKAAISNREPL